MRRLRPARVAGLAMVGLLALALFSGRHRPTSLSPRAHSSATSAQRPPCPASTRPWLQALHIVRAIGTEPGARLVAIDLDDSGGGGFSPSPPILFHPSAVQPCLAAWAAAVTRQPGTPWWQGWNTGKAVVRRGLEPAPTPQLCTVDGGGDDGGDGGGGTTTAAMFTSCPIDDDACFFEAILSLSTPVLWAPHATALSAWLGYDVAAVFKVVVVAWPGGRRSAAMACAPTTPPPTPPAFVFDPAAAMRNLDTLLDRHVALTHHSREGELIEEAYMPVSGAPTNHSISVWFWGGSHFSPSDPAFKDNFGDMAAVYAVQHVLAVRMGVDQDVAGWPPPDIPGVAVTSNGRATRTPYIAAVGSVLAVGTEKPGTKIVWGSGFISPKPSHDVHVDRGPIVWRGVRGPLSRALLLARHGVHTPVIRDPALLVPGLLPCCGINPAKPFDIVFALHAVDVDAFQASALYHNLLSTHPSRFTVASNVNTFPAAVADLWSGARIVASSLHAVIFAHAYGIPVLPVQVTDKVLGGDWKFQDHYYSVGHWGFNGRVALADLDGMSIAGLQAEVDRHWQPTGKDVSTHRMRAAFPLPKGLGKAVANGREDGV